MSAKQKKNVATTVAFVGSLHFPKFGIVERLFFVVAVS